MKLINNLLFWAPLIMLAVGLCFVLNQPADLATNETKAKSPEKIIDKRNDSIKRLNAEKDKQILVLQSRADSLSSKLTTTNHTINFLKHERHETLTQLDSFNANSLYGYFAKLNTFSVQAE